MPLSPSGHNGADDTKPICTVSRDCLDQFLGFRDVDAVVETKKIRSIGDIIVEVFPDLHVIYQWGNIIFLGIC